MLLLDRRMWKHRVSVGAATLLIAVGTARTASASNTVETVQKPPPKYGSSPVRWVVIAGGLGFATFWYGTACAAIAREGCIPVVGPFLFLSRRIREDSEQSSRADSSEGTIPVWYFAPAIASMGAFQAAGLGLATVGALLPERRFHGAASSLRVAPAVSPELAGVWVTGAF